MGEGGRLLLVAGMLLAVLGAAPMLFGRLWVPGDLYCRRGGLAIYVPSLPASS